MKKLLSLTLLTILTAGTISCRDGQTENKILSPKEKVVVLPYDNFINTRASFDTVDELNSFAEINDLWIIGFQKGIYLIDKKTKKVYKYFKFDVKSHKELFDGQGSTVGFTFIDLITNRTKDKLLVNTTNGIAFQIDLKNHEVDWLVKFVHRIETATYSDNGNLIAIGTGYDNDNSNNDYYSSLFLIDSRTGQYFDHFHEYASVKKILFMDSDTKLLVAYDWNYTDSYLWDISKKDKSIKKFAEDQAYLYDIAIIDSNEFVTVNGNGISKWNIQTPNRKNIIFPKANYGMERILENKIGNDYILVAYSKCYFFNNQFKLKDSLDLKINFEDAQYSSNDSLIILKNLMNNNAPPVQKEDGAEGFYAFNLATKELSLYIDTRTINEVLKHIVTKPNEMNSNGE